jgi:hypothetical protein
MPQSDDEKLRSWLGQLTQDELAHLLFIGGKLMLDTERVRMNQPDIPAISLSPEDATEAFTYIEGCVHVLAHRAHLLETIKETGGSNRLSTPPDRKSF